MADGGPADGRVLPVPVGLEQPARGDSGPASPSDDGGREEFFESPPISPSDPRPDACRPFICRSSSAIRVSLSASSSRSRAFGSTQLRDGPHDGMATALGLVGAGAGLLPQLILPGVCWHGGRWLALGGSVRGLGQAG